MIKVLLPLVAFVVVLVGLIATEPPPTREQLDQKQRREMLGQVQSEQKDLLRQLGQLERRDQQLRNQIVAMDNVDVGSVAMRESLERVRAKIAKEKQEAEQSIDDVNKEMRSVERKAEDWVRAAYDLTPDAIPPGYLARVLWQADGTAIAESGKLARDLRATLHITETAAQAAAQRVTGMLRSGYARRTLVSAAAALATIALIESAEPVFGWLFDRWWKLLAAAIAGLIAFGGVVLLQRRKIFD